MLCPADRSALASLNTAEVGPVSMKLLQPSPFWSSEFVIQAVYYVQVLRRVRSRLGTLQHELTEEWKMLTGIKILPLQLLPTPSLKHVDASEA